MRFFYKRENGSITVFLVLIIIPSIFFVGFMDDLARMKLYNNQAVMAADNYGQAIMSEYDNLLKELYGFFAVTQNEEALDALDDLKVYMTTSFNPNPENDPIGLGYESLDLAANAINLYYDYDGCYMPYSNANVTLDYSFDGLNSSLANNDIFATQLGDFMRYRVVQQFIDASGNFTEGDILEALNQAVKGGANDEVAAAKQDCAEPLKNYVTAVQEYYYVLKIINEYNSYIIDAYEAYEYPIENPTQGARVEMAKIAETDDYTNYVYVWLQHEGDFNDLDEEMEKQVEEHKKSVSDDSADDYDKYDTDAYKEAIEDDEKNIDYLEYYWGADKSTREDALNTQFENIIKEYAGKCKISYDADSDTGSYISLTYSSPYYDEENKTANVDISCISVVTFDDAFADLKTKADNVQTALEELQAKIEILEAAVEDPEVSDEVKKTESENIAKIEDLVTEDFENIVTEMENHDVSGANAGYKDGLLVIYNGLKDVKNQYMAGEEVNSNSWPNPIGVITSGTGDNEYITEVYWDYRNDYKEVWDKLDETFRSDCSELKDMADQKQSDAEDIQKEAEEELSKDQETDARNIPENFGFGETLSENNITALFKGLGHDMGNLADGNLDSVINKKILHLYTIAYDFGMFSSRVTNVTPKDKSGDSSDVIQSVDSGDSTAVTNSVSETTSGSSSQNKAMSLTGYEMAKNINYLYGAELEYLLGGSDNSVSNLNETRNYIVAFRLLMNYTATYAIGEINECILTISDACYGIPYVGPAVALLVDIALRSAVSIAETVCDWDALISGEKVPLIKMDIEDLQCLDKIKDLIGYEGGSTSSDGTVGTENTSTSGTNSGGSKKIDIQLSYENYMFVMLVFFIEPELLVDRTQNLVELNVNTVSQGIGSSGELSELTFKLDNAYTAVKTTCTIDSGFVFMPDGFARLVLGAGSETYNSLKTFQDSKYSYSIIRGY